MTKECIDEIIEQNMEKIYLYCLRKVSNTTDAEDLASDIILELLRSYTHINNDGAVYGYLWSIASNLCNNYWRKQSRYSYDELPEEYTGLYIPTPDEDSNQEEELATLRRELSLLSNNYRVIMIDFYFHNMRCEQIAVKMGISTNNVKQYLFEGRKKVKIGMDKQRKYGTHSYAPEKFSMNFWGNSSKGYWELFERKLPGNIMLAIYEKPRTLEELSLEVGVAVPYLEDELEPLEKFEVIRRKGNKYYSNIVIYDYSWMEKIHARSKSVLTEKLDDIKAMIDKGVEALEKSDYTNYMDDLNARRWFILMLLFWEAQQTSEGKMKTHLTFPLLANGSNGYVMGQRGEFPIAIHGIYGMYGLEKGYIRVLNYNMLSDIVLSPFERGHREVLLAAENRAEEMNQVSELPKLLDMKVVRIEDGKIMPCYSEISERDYHSIMQVLDSEIDSLAEIAAKIRDDAGDELSRSIPYDISWAKDIGSIVSMFSILENIVPVVLESGYLTKGKDGQNLTTFYFKK